MRTIVFLNVLIGYCCYGEEKSEEKLAKQMLGAPLFQPRPSVGRQFISNPYGTGNPYQGTTNPFNPFVPQSYEYATCVLQPRGSGYNVNGIVRFRQGVTAYGPSQLEIWININGLNQNSQHGFHVHEYGDLSDDCTSLGEHYNPYGTDHGAPDDSPYPVPQFRNFGPFNPYVSYRQRPVRTRHVGDLGNIETDEYGSLNKVIYDNVARITTDPFDTRPNIIGRGLVLHANPDDLGVGNLDSLTTGNTGRRMACCVISKGNPSLWSRSTTNTQTGFPTYPNPFNQGTPFQPLPGFTGYAGTQPQIPAQGFRPYGGQVFPNPGTPNIRGQLFPNPGEPNLRNSLIPLQPFPGTNPTSNAEAASSKKK